MKKMTWLLLGFMIFGCTPEPESFIEDRVTGAFDDLYISKETHLYTSVNTGDKMDGEKVARFEDGELKAELTFLEGNVVAGKIWHDNGNVFVIFDTDADHDFITHTVSNEEGIKLQKNRLEFGTRSVREMYRWYDDGTPKAEMTPDGITEWYPNGQMKETSEFSNGNQHGRVAKWYENGQLAGESFYVDNKLHGDYREWDEEGRLINSTTYDMGKRLEE